MSSDGHRLHSVRVIRDVFRVHFRDRFTWLPDLLMEELSRYLANFPRLQTAEAASCKRNVTKYEIRDKLKQVSLEQVAGTRTFAIWNVFEAAIYVCAYSDGCVQPLVCPGSYLQTCNQGCDHNIEERLRTWSGEFRLLQAHNSAIFARVLANRLQLVGVLIRTELNYAVKGRSTQNDLHLVRQILAGLDDDAEAALINLDLSKTFDWVGHQFLAAVLETAGFEP